MGRRAEALTLLRDILRRSWAWREKAIAQGDAPALVADEWQRAVDRFSKRIEKLNPRIRSYNLKVPPTLPQLQLPIINVQQEVRRCMSG